MIALMFNITKLCKSLRPIPGARNQGCDRI